MADEPVRNRVELRPVTNLVLESTRDRRVAAEPSGEVASLRGRLERTRMGDRVGRSRPADLDERLQKARAKREAGAGEAGGAETSLSGMKRARGGGRDFLSALQSGGGAEGALYRPRTTETRVVWGKMINFVQSMLGDQPHEILVGAAEEALAELKNEEHAEPMKLSRLQDLLGKMDADAFSRLSTLARGIVDFQAPGAADGVARSGDTEAGVAVFLDEDEAAAEEDEEEPDEVVDEEEAEEDEDVGGEDTAKASRLMTASAGGEADAARGDGEEAPGVIPLSKLDAYWLQRELAKYYPDAATAQQLADSVLSLLGTMLGAAKTSDVRVVENELVLLLDFDKFDLIKLILNNAARIYYVTRLRQAQSPADAAAVRAEMAGDVEAGAPALLAKLDATLSSESWALDRTGQMAARVRKEARELSAAAAAAGAGASSSGGAAGGMFAASDADAEDALMAGASAAAALTAAKEKLPEAVLDLDALTFVNGGHFMANKRVELPPNSWRAAKKGYEEVHVPAPKAKPLTAGEREVPIAELPEWARAAFRNMTKLNRVQSRLYDTAMFSAENMLLCAPTGAGKTNVAMLSIMHEVGMHRKPDGSIDLSAFKIVYVAPMKALVQELVQNFSQRLTPTYGIVVRELSGDVSLTKAEIAETQIIVTTPEKWDVITRKTGDRTYTQLVRLLILDEVHLLHDDRGAVLEALVARTLRQVETTQEMVRIVGLSATLPNYEDVAAFLRVDPARGLFHFDNSYRPCPLQQQYIGITEKKALKRFQLMNDITYEKVAEHAGKDQILVFVHSRKETAKTARALRDAAAAKDALSLFVEEGSANKEVLRSEAEATVRDADLKELLPYGFAIHHAGMPRSDRKLVEDLFADGRVQVLVSTATLAWGVNLPAHTVIIKGTQVYNPEAGAWTELSPLDMMQMLGRAGRPQFDTFGEGIIITGHAELQYYLSLMNQQLPIESQLVAKLADILNAEVVLGTVTNVREAASWLSYTYLYVRMLRNPTLYGLPVDERERDATLMQRRLDLAHTAAVLLDKGALVRYDRRTGTLAPTALGRVASHYYVSHATMSVYNQYLKPTLGDIELFRLFSLSNEFKNIVVRSEEKEELRKLVERVPIPVKEAIDEPSAKVNVLLQAYISNLKLDGFALASDMVYIHQSAGRLMRAIYEISLRRGWAGFAMRALNVAKMVDFRQWLSATPLRQFTLAQGGLNPDVLHRLEQKEIPWERYYDLKAADLGELVRMPKLGKTLHRLVHAVPRVELDARVQPVTRSLLRVELTITPDFAFDPKVHGSAEMFWVLVEDADGEAILHYEAFHLKARYAEEAHTVAFYVPFTDPPPPQYFVRVVSDRWLHSDTVLPISFRSLLLPDKFPPHTELLDLAPLPVSALRRAEYEVLYTSGEPALGPAGALKVFNPIQTQTFATLYESDASAFIAAPSGAGKTLCAEFALLRLFARDPDARAVYVCPREQGCRQRFDEWELKFGRALGKAVVELTGELAADLKLLERAHIVLCTPAQWDALSRRWKRRPLVQSVALFIADELEALHDEVLGATYEVVCSRMRFIATQTAAPLRIVGLSLSLANARDVADWLGIAAAATFNFHPQVRPTPLEVRIQGFDIVSVGARLLSMARPVYAACAQFTTDGAPALVFTPSRKQAQLSAIDIMSFAAADGKPERFLPSAEVAATIASAMDAAGVRDVALRTCASKGVAFYHDGMRPAERTVIEQLYVAGALRVVVAPATSAWSMSTTTWTAHAVIIMGTEAYDGREHRYVDYSIPDVLHMMGRASRTASAGSRHAGGPGRCVILCASTRKEYLKKFLHEPLPIESHLTHQLHDHLNSEVVNEVVTTKQEALDYLTWTLLYRRLAQNPNYYNLQGVDAAHVSDFLSELIDSTLADLETTQCVGVEDEMNLLSLNLGKIAAYYYITYATLEIFATSLSAKTKIKGILEILSSAVEFDRLPVRHGEEKVLRALAAHLPLALPPPASGREGSMYNDPHTKANILLQCHFSRRALPAEMRQDQAFVVSTSTKLLQAMVDVIATEGWLKPALAAMELSQMIVQGLWADKDPVLLQVPHVTREAAAALESLGQPDSVVPEAADAEPVESVFDLMSMDDALRARVLGLSAAQLSDVARFCNRYPNIDVSYDVGAEGGVVAPGDAVPFVVSLEREASTEGLEEGAGIGAVHAPLYPKAKAEGWWLVVGDVAAGTILGIKRVTLAQAARVKVDFVAPTTTGKRALMLYFMSDSYLGCDQEYEFPLTVAADGGSMEVDAATA